jgi:hypothetical protein
VPPTAAIIDAAGNRWTIISSQVGFNGNPVTGIFPAPPTPTPVPTPTPTPTPAQQAPVNGPISGASAGTWQSGNFTNAGITQHYTYLLPHNYSASNRYRLIMHLHWNQQAYDWYNSGADNLTPAVDGYYNTAEFRSAYPAIILMPFCDQRADNGAFTNFGGATTDRQPAETNAIALLNNFIANFAVSAANCFCVGTSMGAIACWAWAVRYNTLNGTVARLFRGFIPFDGNPFEFIGGVAGDGSYPNGAIPNSLITQLTNVPIWSVHGSGDQVTTWGQGVDVRTWDEPIYRAWGGSIPGNGSRAPSSQEFFYEPGIGHGSWGDNLPLPNGKVRWDWAFNLATVPTPVPPTPTPVPTSPTPTPPPTPAPAWDAQIGTQTAWISHGSHQGTDPFAFGFKGGGGGGFSESDGYWSDPPQQGTGQTCQMVGSELRLGCIVNPGGFTNNNGGDATCVSTIIVTFDFPGNMYMQYGYHEFSVRLQNVRGFLFHFDIEDYNPWNELDIDIWIDGNGTHHVRANDETGSGEFVHLTNIDVTQNHRYGMDWQSGWVRFYVDGVLKGEIGNNYNRPFGAYFLVDTATYYVHSDPIQSLPAYSFMQYYRVWNTKP